MKRYAQEMKLSDMFGGTCDQVELSKLDRSQSKVLEIKRVYIAFARCFWVVPTSQPITDGYSYPRASSARSLPLRPACVASTTCV